MKGKGKFLLLLVVTCLLSSCLDILEEVKLNKNGSGTYAITMDMSALFSDPMMKGMVEGMLQEEGVERTGSLEMDTVLNLSDVPLDELAPADRAVLKDLVIKLQASEAKEQLAIKMTYDFTELEDIAKLTEVLEKQGEKQSGAGSMMGAGLLPKANLFQLKKRAFTRLPAPAPDTSVVAGENADMIKMFLADAAYKTIYYLPGKVKSTTMEAATVDGKTVTVQHDLIDIFEGKADMTGTIKFKRR